MVVTLLCCICTVSFGQVTQASILWPKGTKKGVANDKHICNDTITLVGNSPQTNETGYWDWTGSSSPVQFLSDSTNDTVTVKLLITTEVTLYWTISSNVDNSLSLAPVYLFNDSPSQAIAGNDVITCVPTATLSANAPTIGKGTWNSISGGSLGYTPNINTAKAKVSNLIQGNNLLVWQISNSPACPNIHTDTVVISNLNPDIPNAGPDTVVCARTVKLHAKTPALGTIGKWILPDSVVLRTNYDIHDPRAVVDSLHPGRNTFVWATFVDSSKCVLRDTVVITASQLQMATISNKTFVDTTLCSNQVALVINKPLSGNGNGIWKVVNGAGTVVYTPPSTQVNVTNLGVGMDSLTWTIQNTNCGSSTASIRIRNNAATKPIVTKDSCFIAPFSASYGLGIKNSLRSGESGVWTLKKSPPGNITLDSLSPATATFNMVGAGLYTFLYQVNGISGCKSSDSTHYHLTRRARLYNDTCVFAFPSATVPNPIDTFLIKARTSAKVSQGEKGIWQRISNNTPVHTILASTDSTYRFYAPAGVYVFTYTISNGSCSTIDTIMITISNHAKILPMDSNMCFKSSAHLLKAVAYGAGESGVWSSPNGVTFTNPGPNSITTTGNFPIGRSKIVWKVNHLNGCVSVDSLKTVSRLTTPNAGLDKCEPFDLSVQNFKDSTFANSYATNTNETGIWLAASSPPLTYVSNSPLLGIGKPPSAGVYKMVWKINTPECQTGFSDTVIIKFVTKPVAIRDTFFIVPLSAKPIIKSTTPPGVGELSRWINATDTIKTPNFTLPDSTAGKYTYQYQIYNGTCSFSATSKVTLITSPKIIPQYCLRNQANVPISAKYFVTSGSGDTSIWSVDTSKYKVGVQIIPNNNSNQILINFYNGTIINGRILIRHYVKSGSILVKDSMYVTNLSKPIVLPAYCAPDTFVNLPPPPSFPVLQSYEKPKRIKQNKTDPGTFKNGGTLSDVLYGLSPGQQKLAVVITDTLSGCADTSAYTVLTVVTKARAFPSTYLCLYDTTTTLSTKTAPIAGIEKGKWKYLSSYLPKTPSFAFQNDSISNTKISGLGDYTTKLAWTISNRKDSTCFSTDTTYTTLVVQHRAKVSYSDTCIIGSSGILLRAQAIPSYEKGAWLKVGSTDTISQNNIASYTKATLGINKFIWTILDPAYRTCQSSDTLKAQVLNKAKIVSAPTCSIKLDNIAERDTLQTLKDSLTSGLSYKWTLNNPFPQDSIQKMDSTKASYRYVSLFHSPGIRTLTWSVSTSPICHSDTSIQITVIQKAKASVSSTCVISSTKTDLLGNPVSGTGAVGKWRSFLKSSPIIDTAASSTSALLIKGKTGFIWNISNGLCQSSDTVYAILLSKANIGRDTCLYDTPSLQMIVHNAPISSEESFHWSFNNASLKAFTLDSITTRVTGFAHGTNKLTWKVSMEKCADSSTVTYTTLTKSGFGQSDTTFTCSKNTSISSSAPDTALKESVSWKISPLSASISNQRPNGLDLTGLNNDSVYTLYRYIGSDSIGHKVGCPLVDSIKIRNRQLDTVWASPQNIQLGDSNQYFTCFPTISLSLFAPSKDIATANGQLTVVQPATNIGGGDLLKINNNPGIIHLDTSRLSFSSNQATISNVNGGGLYSFTWKVQNRTFCSALATTILIEKKGGLTDNNPISKEVCDTLFNFAGISLFSSSPDSVRWSAYRLPVTNPADTANVAIHLTGNPTSSNGADVTVQNLQFSTNSLFFYAYKGGCKGLTQIYIRAYSKNYDVRDTLDKSPIFTCNKNSDTLTAYHTLTSLDLDHFDFYWSNKKDGIDSTNLVSLPKVGDRTQKIIVQNVVPNNPTKLYIYSKNGVCPAKYDSVTIRNFSIPIAHIEDNSIEVCGSSTTLLSKIGPSTAQGKWTTNAPANANFSSINTTTTVLSGLRSSDTVYTAYWTVTNGACRQMDSIRLRVNDAVSDALILSPKLQSNKDSVVFLCDASSIYLKSKAPIAGFGKWTLGGDSIAIDTNYTYSIPSQTKDSLFSFAWNVYNKKNNSCLKSDTIKVLYYKAPSQAKAGSSESIVTNSTTLSATPPVIGIGTWEVLKGNGIIADIHDPTTQVTNLNFGENKFNWVVTNGPKDAPCPSSSDFVVIAFNDFSIPQGFSPNGDQKNDKFEIKGLENYKDTELKVFNRWGQEVYSSSNYQNSWEGEGLNDDTYYYVMTLVNGRKYHGHVILKRK
jgi:gliding motility-associated-like protein